jgi:uncharacterized protein YigE (DUF2233 family)
MPRRRSVLRGLGAGALGTLAGLAGRPPPARADNAALGPVSSLIRAPGLAVDSVGVSRPGQLLNGRLLVARFDPAGVAMRVASSLPARAAQEAWRLTVNASFFDPQGRPIRLLQEGGARLAPFRGGTSAVFWCLNGDCQVTHARDYADGRPVDIAVESTPRILANGAPTSGVRDPSAVDARAGIGVTGDGQVIVFATDRWGWSGLAFGELAQVLGPLYGARDVLMLDGGSSVTFRAETPETSVGAVGPGRSVPYLISFAWPR